VEQKQLYDLKPDGSLSPTVHNVTMTDQDFNIFNIDATYTWEFAPGSFINVVWKNQALATDGVVENNYFKNFDHTIAQPQNNNLSIKVIYYLDYLDLKKWKKIANNKK
jgi:hypothetical protein